MRNLYKKEKGQAIVLIALAMVALIAFAGLAIDGGMVYADRRHAQNASDAGSLSGGGATALALENEFIDYQNFECPPLNDDGTYGEGTNNNEIAVKTALDAAEAAAIAQMENNGYTDVDFSVETFCYESIGNNFNNYIDITTTITKETELTFIEIVYDGPFINRVDATTEVTPRAPYAFGNAIIALNKETDCDNASAGGIKFGGTGEVDISGGGAFSDGCLVAKGNCNVQMDFTGWEEDAYLEGIGYYGGNFGVCPVMIPDPISSTMRLPPESYMIPPPKCLQEDVDDGKTIIWDDQIKIGNKDVYTIPLSLGSPNATLLCLRGTGTVLKMTDGELYNTGVTIYLEDGGDIDITGGTVIMDAPPFPQSAADPGISGVIIYAANDDEPDDPDTDTFDNNPESDINIEGNQYSKYTGLIYGPAADIKITGTGDFGLTLNTQIIGWNVTLLGTATYKIEYDDSWAGSFAAMLNLKE